MPDTPTSPDRVRVAVWRGAGRITLEELPTPVPVGGEVLVGVDLATVCGSDRHTVSGRRQSPCPGVLGHEAVGTVQRIGPDGARDAEGRPLRVGQRVVWSVTVGCGDCDRCRAGRSAKCRTLRKVGHEPFEGRWPLSGSYASHLLLPLGTAVVGVPDRLPDGVAAPAACATATVLAAVERAGPLAGRRVLVCGAGMLGLTAVALAAEQGAAEVLVSDVDPGRLERARRFGATTLHRAGSPLPEVDVALELSGSAAAVAAALEALDVGGRLVLAGSVAPGPAVPLDPERVVRRWLSITGVHNYEPGHLVRAVGFLDATPHRPWQQLVSAPVGLDQLQDVLTGASGPEAVRVALVP